MKGDDIKKKLDNKNKIKHLSKTMNISESELEDILNSDNVPEDKITKIAKYLDEFKYYFEPNSKPNIIEGNSNQIGSHNQSTKIIMKLLEIIEKKDAIIEKLVNKH